MSYEIEYKREAYYLENEQNKFNEKDFIVFVQEGSNNCYEISWSGRQKRERSWKIIQKGWEYSIIQEICYRSGFCEGGSLKLNGRDVTPESYLKLYRKLLKSAKPFSEFNKDFLTKEFVINVKNNLSDYEKDLLKELENNKKFKKDVYEWNENDKETRFITEINNEDDLKEVLKYRILCRYNDSKPTIHLKEVY